MTDKLDFTKRKSFKKSNRELQSIIEETSLEEKKVKLKSTEENHSDIIMKNGGKERAAYSQLTTEYKLVQFVDETRRRRLEQTKEKFFLTHA